MLSLARRLSWYSPIFNTPPDVEHLVCGHPLHTLSTTTLNFSLSLSLSVNQRKLSTYLGLPLRYRAILMDCLQTPPALRSRRLASLVSLRILYRILSRSFTSTVQPKSDSLCGCVSTFLQMLLLLVMFPCCLVSPLPLPGPCQTCQTQSVRNARPAQEAINN